MLSGLIELSKGLVLPTLVTIKPVVWFGNFLFLICKLRKNWSSKHQKIKLIKDIKKQVNKNKMMWLWYNLEINYVSMTTLPNPINSHFNCR